MAGTAMLRMATQPRGESNAAGLFVFSLLASGGGVEFCFMPPPLPKPSRHAFFESLEARQMLAISPVIAGTKIKGINLSSGGVSTNQTLITVPFTDNVVLSNVGLIRMFGYALN